MLSCSSHIDLPVSHRFINGRICPWDFYSLAVYWLLVESKNWHISIISQGCVEVVTDNVVTGEVLREIYQSSLFFISPVGTKRMVQAVEDTVWTTIHKAWWQHSPKTSKIFTWPGLSGVWRRSYWLCCIQSNRGVCIMTYAAVAVGGMSLLGMDCQAQSRQKSPKEANAIARETLNFNKQRYNDYKNNVWRFRTAACEWCKQRCCCWFRWCNSEPLVIQATQFKTKRPHNYAHNND